MLERRGPNAVYCYRYLKRQGRCRRIYVAAGPAAEAAAAEDRARRAAREELAEARRVEQARWAALEAPLQELALLSDLVVSAAFVLAGYRQHDRGPWRFRRHATPS
jgi:hypothetical protein